MPLRALHRLLEAGPHIERRFEPWFRPQFDATLREPLAKILQYLINVQRHYEGLGLAEEKPLPDEEKWTQQIIDEMAAQMHNHFQPVRYERGGNTKTHGLVRGTFTVRDDVPSHMRHGIFAAPRSFPGWIRYSGPGPTVPADIDDVGFGSMTIKLMGVEGESSPTTTKDSPRICFASPPRPSSLPTAGQMPPCNPGARGSCRSFIS